MPVRGLYDVIYDVYTGYDLTIFKNLSVLKPNRRVCGARENRTKIAQSRHGGFAEVARKGGYDQFTGSIDTSQATCELGLSCITAMIDR